MLPEETERLRYKQDVDAYVVRVREHYKPRRKMKRAQESADASEDAQVRGVMMEYGANINELMVQKLEEEAEVLDDFVEDHDYQQGYHEVSSSKDEGWSIMLGEKVVKRNRVDGYISTLTSSPALAPVADPSTSGASCNGPGVQL